jgi:hypothetical protein
MALSADQLALAGQGSASFIVRLESVGLTATGGPDESQRHLLAERSIDAALLNAANFTQFDVTAIVPDGALVGTWLRVGVYSLPLQGQGVADWQVKLDSMELSYSVPEPAALSVLMLAGLVMRRRKAV